MWTTFVFVQDLMPANIMAGKTKGRVRSLPALVNELTWRKLADSDSAVPDTRQHLQDAALGELDGCPVW